jgi:hypothetical protein
LKKLFSIVSFGLLSLCITGQNTTLSTNQKPARELAVKHKVMLIPFEPKLYLSEIDRAINAETKLSAKQIKYTFRNGINEQLYKAFKTANYTVVDLMDDTAKYRKDLEGIYQYLTYHYQKVPNQDDYKAPTKEKEEAKIEKGQLNIETNGDARFMNAKLTNAKVVPLLYAKYKTDVFMFINQLDLKAANADANSSMGLSSKRKIVLHYTVYTYDAKEINSGIVETNFDAELNNPKKISDKYFSKIATTMVQRVNKGLGIIK